MDTEPRPEVARLLVLRNELEAAVARATAVLSAARARPAKQLDVLL